MKIQKDILELEVFPKRIVLYTSLEDYTLRIENISKVALKEEGGSIHIYFSLKESARDEKLWPEILIQSQYLKLPEVFDAESFDIISENENLKELCINLGEFS
jgi:hypothetical protein